MINEGGREVPVEGGNPVFSNVNKSTARASWPLIKGSFEFEMSEKGMTIRGKGLSTADWFLDLYVADKEKTAFLKIAGNTAVYSFDGHQYSLHPAKGRIEATSNGSLYRVHASDNVISFKLEDRHDQ